MSITPAGLENKYHGYKTEGKPVFFKTDPEKTSFHFDLSDLKWSFSYGAGDPGPTPSLDGVFYYNPEFFSQHPDEPIDADFYVNKSVRLGNILYAHFTFYAPKPKGAGDELLLGEFLGKDLHNVVGAFESREKRLPGKWDAAHDGSLIDRLKKKYGGSGTSLKASFVKGGTDVTSLHFSNDDLGWEFSYGDAQGNSALDGTFFYYDGYFDNEHPDARAFDADFQVAQVTDKTVHYVLLQFYKSKSGKTDELFGELVAPYSGNEAADTGLLEKHYQGVWKRLKVDWTAQLIKKYGHKTPAEGLFYKGSVDPKPISFLFEAYELGLELSGGSFAIGRRLPGILYYGDDFKPGTTNANYRVQRILQEDGKFYALIQFYKPGKVPVFFGEFLAADPDNVASKYGLFSGKWKETNYSTANATASKNSNDTLITLSIDKHAAEIHCNEGDEVYGEKFNVPGVLAYKSAKDLGSFVKWYTDRAIFYEDKSAKDFTSFFYPTNVADKLGSKDYPGWAATWKDTKKA